jgi:hypothetical protein
MGEISFSHQGFYRPLRIIFYAFFYKKKVRVNSFTLNYLAMRLSSDFTLLGDFYPEGAIHVDRILADGVPTCQARAFFAARQAFLRGWP